MTSQSTFHEEFLVVEQGDTYNAAISGSIVGGHGNTNTINIHNHALGIGKTATLFEIFALIYCKTDYDTFTQRVAVHAIYDSIKLSEEVPTPSPGIRQKIQDRILDWAAAATYDKSITWVYGPPRSGKSVLMKATADMLHQRGVLLASFFFTRRIDNLDRPQWFISTIAYQIARTIPEMRNEIVRMFNADPVIFNHSLESQANDLIIKPIRKIVDEMGEAYPTAPRVIVVDAIDECGTHDDQISVLRVLRYLIQQLPIPIAVIISSRPQIHISNILKGRESGNMTSTLDITTFTEDDEDIRNYLTERLDLIGKAASTPFRTLLPPGVNKPKWPKSSDIDRVTSLASGDFIYILMVEHFVKIQKYPGTYFDYITQPNIVKNPKNAVMALTSLATSGTQGLARVSESMSAVNLMEVKWTGLGDEETVRYMLEVLKAPQMLLENYLNWQRNGGQTLNSARDLTQRLLSNVQAPHLPSPSAKSDRGGSSDIISMVGGFAAKSFFRR
ncbi:hypothetical protein CVT26_004259 [Gymnopilus dilepis]|uniref:Nephrocystin 3-like N-terminal domain-containing protein n=1 Tax=Gymnopilus dilepis TaxID=231916 RepID=A0A409YVG3_9AGAR|nr:hypothetical protein CVT26_004259 [Gymnopilus dilepis]